MRYTLFAVYLLQAGMGISQTGNVIAHKKIMGPGEGLPVHEVLCGTQDNNGFQWFGTRNGLCRYDGVSFVMLTKKDFKLRGASINHLCMDDKDGLIITYNDLGSSYYSSEKKDVININTFEVQPIHEYYKSLPFKESEINTIHNESGIVVYTTDHLRQKWNYSFAGGFIRDKSFYPVFSYLSPDNYHNVKNTKVIFQAPTKMPYSIYLFGDSSVYIPPFFVEPQPEIYYELVCKQNGGNLIYSKSSTNTKVSYFFLNNNGTFSCVDSIAIIRDGFLKNNVKTFCISDNDKSTVLHCENGNVLFYTADYGFIPLHESTAEGKRKTIHINSFYKDQSGSYWFCSNEGLIHLTINAKLFKSFFEISNSGKAIDNSARGIYASNDSLFCNLVDGTVLKTTKGTQLFADGHRYTYAICKTDNELWFGSLDLKLYNPKNNRIDVKAKSIQEEIWSIFEADENQLILGCTNGLSVYNKISGTIRPVTDTRFPAAKFIYKLFRNNENQLLAVSEKGIYFLSDSIGISDLYSSFCTNAQKKLPCESIYDVYQDKAGIYWIASNNEGLYRWDKTKGEFKQFGIDNGFMSTVIYCIQEDNFGNLWLSTDFGLIRFNKTTHVIKTYTEIDGISQNEFNRTSSYKDKKGNLYFGGVNGLTSFNPQDFSKETRNEVFPLRITSYNQFNTRTNSVEDKTSDIFENPCIVFTDNIKFSTLSFSLLDYISREHLYAYKIEGVDSEWNYIKTNSIRIGGLPYGNYTLKIKAQTIAGMWNKEEIQIPLIVIAPFYKTYWFISIAVFLFLLSIFIFIKIRFRILRSENKKLEVVVEKRTSELQISLREKTALIQEIHHRVKNNLQFVGAMLEMQVNEEQKNSNYQSLLATSRRINAMTLVHEMLYSKDNLESVSLKAYLKELVDKINAMVNESNLPIHFVQDVEEIYFDINTCVAIGMISSELLSNSIKYAFASTDKPVIQMVCTFDSKNNTVRFVVQDNGIGFEKTENATGFGLKLVDIFCRQLKGTYRMENRSGFYFELSFKPKKLIL